MQYDQDASGRAYELMVSVFEDADLASVFDLTRCTLKRCGSLERMRDPEVWMWRRHTRTWMPS